MSTMTIAQVGSPRRGGFLISPAADVALLVGSPLLALLATWPLSLALGGRGALRDGDMDATWFGFAFGALVTGHLAVTLVHTHGNAAVFRAHRLRFTLVPALLLAALACSHRLRLIALVASVAWDVHHSGMQTFGLARLYSRRAGGDGLAGRRLDLLLNHALYAGPVLAGTGLLIHWRASGAAELLGTGATDALETLAGVMAPLLRAAVVALGLAAIAAHVVGHVRLARRGAAVSPQAVALLAATGLTSIVSWGFDPFGMALFTMKLFHCVQYFTLVAFVEKGQVASLLGRPAARVGLRVALAALLLPALAFGALARFARELGSEGAIAIVLTLTLLHFWYDGFTWSARPAKA